MNRHDASLSPSYFESLYESDPDPWQFATSDYERAKYAATLAALPRMRYAAGLEIGCSIGVLTQELADRCSSLLAIDVAETALAQARHRCASKSNLRFAEVQVPAQWPQGTFDLIMLSEVVYYLVPSDIVRLVHKISISLLPEADLVLVHWTGETDYPMSGDDAAEMFIQETASFLHLHHQARMEHYRLDVLRSKRLQDMTFG